MLNLKNTDWERPMVDIFPALADFVKKHPGKEDPTDTIQWEDVTVSAIAAQIAGLPTNPLLLDIAITFLDLRIDPTTRGYPMVNLSSPQLVDAIPALADVFNGRDLDADDFLAQVKAGLPNFEPWTQPVYSNNGFIMLTAAIQAITGKNLSTLGENSILEPLDMTSSFYDVVPPSQSRRSVIANDTEWARSAGVAVGSGGLATTVADLSKFGISILNSTLLPRVETRRWLKPVSHTARFQYAMGRPWEILRYTHASGAVTDLYTKAGDSGSYSSYFVIIPDYDAGFVVLGASTSDSKNAAIGAISDIVANLVLPALEKQALEEAERNFAGTYTSTVQGLNSSLVLCVNKTEGAAPGLLIDSFISNGSDFTAIYPLYYAEGARLTPSILSDNKGKLAFRVVAADDAPSVDKSGMLFAGAGSASFLIGDATSYGGASLAQWVFEVDEGEASSITSTFLQTTLKKTKS